MVRSGRGHTNPAACAAAGKQVWGYRIVILRTIRSQDSKLIA
jgi:hypothetical protein